MEARAITKFIRLSPRKVRLVVDQIRGKGVEEALNILKFTPKRSALIVSKTLRTAVANAESTQSVDVDQLYVKQANVDEAGIWKRFTPRRLEQALAGLNPDSLTPKQALEALYRLKTILAGEP